MILPDKENAGKVADAVLRALNIADVSVHGVIGYERMRRLAQGNTKLAKQAFNTSKAYAGKAGLIGLGIEAGNTAWLIADPKKREQALADYEKTAEKPGIERMFEGYLSPSDMLYGTGKTVYDMGKTYESIERSEIEAPQKALLRKIAVHEAQLELDRKRDLKKNELADYVMSAIKLRK